MPVIKSDKHDTKAIVILLPVHNFSNFVLQILAYENDQRQL